MRLAILSDIHGNIHALEKVMRDIDERSPDRIVCLGDLVGYGVFPNEVVGLIRERNIPTIMGNYDDGVGFDREDCGCVYTDPEDDRLGKLSLLWSREHTREENKSFLRSFPDQIREEINGYNVLFVHGSPRRINEYLYEDRPEATFHRIAEAAAADVILFGHTHLPYSKRVNGALFINTGSVGKPKDGNPDAGYIMLDLSGQQPVVDFHRVRYDIQSAVDAIRTSSMPDHFAYLLQTGGVVRS
jgi:putative phosphoesterase